LKKIFTFMGWIFAGFVLLGVVLFGIGSIFIIIITALSGGIGDGGMAELNIKSEYAVGLVELSGEIISSDDFRERLNKYGKNEKIRAIVVRIESPGGSVGASEEIYRAIKLVDAVKPVVCSLGNIAASGGLYSAVGCRKIVTNEGTLTGSIGVILMMPNFSSVIDKIGFSMNVIKSGKFKDSGSPFRSFDPEDQVLLQSLVDQSYEQFLRVISESRQLPVDEVRKFADGRIILGEQAVAWGLADEIGGVQRAAKLALELSGEEEAEPEIIKPAKRSGIFAIIDELSESRIVTWIKAVGRLRLLYQAYL